MLLALLLWESCPSPAVCWGWATFHLHWQQCERWGCTTLLPLCSFTAAVTAAQVEERDLGMLQRPSGSTKEEPVHFLLLPASPLIPEPGGVKGKGPWWQWLMLPAGVPRKHSLMEGWYPGGGEQKQQEDCMVKGARRRQGAEQMGEETKWITGGDSRFSVTLKAQIHFVICKAKEYFHDTVSTPHIL